MHKDLGDLLDEVRQLAEAMTRDEGLNDAFAEEAQAIARMLGRDDADLISRRLREMQRRHVIKSLETQGRLAALIHDHFPLPDGVARPRKREA